MKNKQKTIFILGVLSTLLLIPTISSQTAETTSIEIIGISGGVGGVTVDIKNTGEVIANDVWVITTISGGILGNIDITHECAGCSVCGTTLDPGAVKSEDSREAGFLFGFGPIEVSVAAGASNADDISMDATGFALGLFSVIQ